MTLIKALELCKWAIDLFLKSKSNDKEKIIELSGLLEKISEVLEDTAKKLEIDEYPHKNCAILENLSFSLLDKLRAHLGKADLEDLTDSLLQASQVEKLYALRKQDNTIETIYQASGKFKALSMTIKI